MDTQAVHDAPQIVTRSQAIAAGTKNYFTGKPCPKGHVAERQVCDWRCVECRRIYRRERLRSDEVFREKVLEKQRVKYASNPTYRDEAKRRASKRVKANPEAVAAYLKEHYVRNKPRIFGSVQSLPREKAIRPRRAGTGECAQASGEEGVPRAPQGPRPKP